MRSYPDDCQARPTQLMFQAWIRKALQYHHDISNGTSDDALQFLKFVLAGCDGILLEEQHSITFNPIQAQPNITQVTSTCDFDSLNYLYPSIPGCSHCLAGEAYPLGIEPSPITLTDAMKCWTAASIDEILLHTTFKASNAGLDNNGSTPGSQGPRSSTFPVRMCIYFPNASVNSPPRKDSDWSLLWSQSEYIASYHRSQGGASSTDEFYMANALEEIFSHLQCLLESQKATKKSKRHVWKIEKGSFVFVTNPRFYKIESLSKESQKKARGTRGPRLLKSKKVLQAELYHPDAFDGLASKTEEAEHQRRRARIEKLSMKTKNKPKPPQRSKKVSFELPELEPEDEDDLDVQWW